MIDPVRSMAAFQRAAALTQARVVLVTWYETSENRRAIPTRLTSDQR